MILFLSLLAFVHFCRFATNFRSWAFPEGYNNIRLLNQVGQILGYFQAVLSMDFDANFLSLECWQIWS